MADRFTMEEELQFALQLALVRHMKPRRRAVYLRELLEIAASWEDDAQMLRGDGVRSAARKAAAAWIKETVPGLLM